MRNAAATREHAAWITPEASMTHEAPLPRARGHRAEIAVALGLGALLAANAAAMLAPGMWLWGLDAGRFLPPALAWGGWLLMALALVPLLSRRVDEALRAVAVHRHAPLLAWVVGALVPAAVVLMLPDRTWFVSDFILRLGTILGTTPAQRLFPQALPLDLLLHVDLPRAVARAPSWDIMTTERVLGAAKAGVLGLLGVALASELRTRGAVALAVYALVACGGWLQLLTGYGKATADLPIVVAALGVFGLREVRGGNGAVGVAIATAAGLLLHRSAVAIVPVAIVAAMLGDRARASLAPERRLRARAWYAVPLVVFVALAPRLASLATGYDRAHLAPAGAGLGGALGAAFGAGHLLDLGNLVAQLSPIALLLPILAARPRSPRGAQAALMAAIVVPWVLEMLFVHPHDQGIVRDWDTFAAAGTALAVATAWALAELLRDDARLAWLGVAAAAATIVPTIGQIALNHDVHAGMTRVEAFVAGPPRRPVPHRALALDYLGGRARTLGDRDAAASAYRRAAQISPGARVLYNWALAEGERGEYQVASGVLERLLATFPPTPQAWYTLAAVRTLQGDSTGARAAVDRSLALAPRGREALELRARLGNVSAGR